MNMIFPKKVIQRAGQDTPPYRTQEVHLCVYKSPPVEHTMSLYN